MTGFDSASTFAGEVAQPQTTFPRALFAAVATVTLGYLLPLLVSAAADPHVRRPPRPSQAQPTQTLTARAASRPQP